MEDPDGSFGPGSLRDSGTYEYTIPYYMRAFNNWYGSDYPIYDSSEESGLRTASQQVYGSLTSTISTTAFQFPGLDTLPVSDEPYVTCDSLGRYTALVDVAGGVTRFTYDAAGNLASLTDPVGNTTVWVYDEQGNLVEATGPAANGLELPNVEDFIQGMQEDRGHDLVMTAGPLATVEGITSGLPATAPRKSIAVDRLFESWDSISTRQLSPCADAEDIALTSGIGKRAMMASEPVGHHWVPQSVYGVLFNQGKLSDAAKRIFEITTSASQLDPRILRHINDTWNDVTHNPEYITAVRELLANFIDQFGDKGVLQEDMAIQFVSSIENGKHVSAQIAAFFNANKAAWEKVCTWRKGFIQSVSIAQQALLENPRLTETQLKNLAKVVVNKDRTIQLSKAEGLVLKKLQGGGIGLARRAAGKLLPVLMVVSITQCATRGYAGEGFIKGGGITAALGEVQRDFVCADLVEAAVHAYADAIDEWLFPGGGVSSLEGPYRHRRFGDLLPPPPPIPPRP